MTRQKLNEYVNALNKTFGSENRSYEVGSVGRTYARIVMKSYGSRSAWGFIVMNRPKGNDHLHPGDLLKAASWKSPATNVARGNILKGTDMSQWTGPVYMNSHGRPTPHGTKLEFGLLGTPKTSNPFELV